MNEKRQHRRRAGHWTHFQHVADIGLRGYGAGLAEAFEQAAVALTGVITAPASVNAVQCVELTCCAPDVEILLVDWLNDLVYEMATRRMLFSRFEVRIEEGRSGFRLTGRAWGEPVAVERHQPAAEVKGVTMSELSVREDSDGIWCAQCIVDV